MNGTDSKLTELMVEYSKNNKLDDLRKAYWDLCAHILYAAAALGDDEARGFIKEHDLQFNFGPKIDIDTVRVV